MTTVYRTKQNEPVDLICWRHYGRTSGVVEQVLALPANRHLADLPILLPLGVYVTLPDIAEPDRRQAQVKLWD